MSDDIIVYAISVVVAIIVFLALFGLITAEIRLLMWLFGM